VTSPSSGVPPPLRARLDCAVRAVRDSGYDVVIGDCMDGTSHVSAPAPARAAELMEMLTDPSIRAVVPPWGGETAIDLLPLLDWAAVAAAEPTWLVGFSDTSTLMVPMTLATGIATLHGNNLMDTPYRVPGDLLRWLDIVALPPGASFTQSSPGRYRAGPFDDWEHHPAISDMRLDGAGSWTRLDGRGPVDVTGRLIGGCIETISHLCGSPAGDVAEFAARHAPDGLIVYVEAAGDDAFTICRSLHGMRLAGFFAAARAVLVGRPAPSASATMTQHEAVTDALGGLGVPVIADVECGHVPPYLPLVNGALARVRLGGGTAAITQTLA
jgi:muramoyltetrapeptide carboxypeptidase LdcA involved in peptidoglycan recycling